MKITINWFHFVLLLVIFLVALLIGGQAWPMALFVTAASALVLQYIGV